MARFDHTTRLTSAADLTPVLDSLAAQLHWSDKARFQVELALEELVVNTFNYGFKAAGVSSDAAFIDMSIEQVGLELAITLEDQALAFDPTQFSEPDVTSSAENRNVGGLGLFFVSKMMDDIRYDYRDGRNHVVLRKRMA